MELLAVDVKHKTEPVPIEDGSRDLVEVREIQIIR
jgi:hypothetical protein